MTEQQRRDYFNQLMEEHAWGNNLTSAWTDSLSVDAMRAFHAGAYLSAILVGQAAMETHLRYEYYRTPCPDNWGFFELINNSSLNNDVKSGLHSIRKYRNKWVHVKDTDSGLRERPEYHDAEMESVACQAMRLMFITLYQHQIV